MLARPNNVLGQAAPHPGFVLIDADGSARAYINCRPGPDVVAAWKERYPDHDELRSPLATRPLIGQSPPTIS